MTVRNIEPSSAGAVAKLMSTIKPDWWDFEGADQQLQDVGLLAKLVDWYLEEDGAPCALWDGGILTTSAPSVLCPPDLSPTATGRITTASS